MLKTLKRTLSAITSLAMIATMLTAVSFSQAVVSAQDVNLSLGETAIADSNHGSWGNGIATMNDGDFTTRWQSATAGSAENHSWGGIKYATPTAVNKIVAYFETSRPSMSGVAVEVSDDGEAWTPVLRLQKSSLEAITVNPTSGEECNNMFKAEMTFGEVTTSYIRVYMTTSETANNYYSIWELETYKVYVNPDEINYSAGTEVIDTSERHGSWGGPKETMVDGIYDTDPSRWQSAHGLHDGDVWAAFKYPVATTINSAVVYFETRPDRIASVNIETSTDGQTWTTVKGLQRGTTEDLGNRIYKFTFDFDTLTTSYLRIYIKKIYGYGGGNICIREFETYCISGKSTETNLSVDAAVNASERHGSWGCDKESINDGDFQTRWQANKGLGDADAFVALEYPALTKVNKAVLYFETRPDRVASITIETSEDGQNWTKVAGLKKTAWQQLETNPTTGGTGDRPNMVTLEFADVNTKYIRAYMQKGKRFAGGNVSVWEFQTYYVANRAFDVNLSTSAAASASIAEHNDWNDYVAAIADSDYETRFQLSEQLGSDALKDTGVYYTLEYPTAVTVNNMKAYFNGGDKPYGNAELAIEVSDDNAEWNTVHTQQCGEDALVDMSFDAITTKYIRLHVKGAGGYISLNELETYYIAPAAPSFSMKGAQLRENGEAYDLRFVANLPEEIFGKLDTVTDLGMVLVRADQLTAAGLTTDDITVDLQAENLVVKKISAVYLCNTYLEDTDCYTFTTAITGISDFDREYVCVAYYTTAEGTVYTDAITRCVNDGI